MRVLVACEVSGRVRDAFRNAGIDAWSCDLMGPDSFPDSKFYADLWRAQEWPNYHLEGNCLDFLAGYNGAPWDMLIGFPPCTYLCNSGVRWLHTESGRMAKMRDGAELFNALWHSGIPRIALENPIMHGYARRLIDGAPSQTIQPWQYGHGETKATQLWLRGLPLLTPTNIVYGRAPLTHYASPGPFRGIVRGITKPGIALAMATQWAQATVSEAKE